MSQLPTPMRATIGLVAFLVDEVRHLPDRAIDLPMLAVSTVLQMSLRAQQRYAYLTARGDALLSRTRITDEPPSWATFDDPVDPGSGPITGHGEDDAVDGLVGFGAPEETTATRGKTVHAPRNGRPSAFDTVGE